MSDLGAVAANPGLPRDSTSWGGEAVLVGLKDCAWERSGDALIVMLDRREVVHLVDRDGSAELLLSVLRDRPQSPEDLLDVLAARGVEVDAEQLAAGLHVLDQAGLVEDATGLGLEDPQSDARHFSNLAFFGQFSDLNRSRASFVRRIRRAHVVQLGVGGGGSAIVQCLAGMGVGSLTLVDRDDVEPPPSRASSSTGTPTSDAPRSTGRPSGSASTTRRSRSVPSTAGSPSPMTWTGSSTGRTS